MSYLIFLFCKTSSCFSPALCAFAISFRLEALLPPFPQKMLPSVRVRWVFTPSRASPSPLLCLRSSCRQSAFWPSDRSLLQPRLAGGTAGFALCAPRGRDRAAVLPCFCPCACPLGTLPSLPSSSHITAFLIAFGSGCLTRLFLCKHWAHLHQSCAPGEVRLSVV